jgi:hypothetical protein
MGIDPTLSKAEIARRIKVNALFYDIEWFYCYMFRKIVQINYIFSDNVHILYIYTDMIKDTIFGNTILVLNIIFKILNTKTLKGNIESIYKI